MAAPSIDRPSPTGADREPASAPDPRGIGLAALAGLVVTVAGLFIGLQPLRDNSFWTHLATGRLILADGAVPTVDPYSFTAPGVAWTVQSWLASVAYAGAESLGGLGAVRILVGLTTALLAWLLWCLTEPAGAVVARIGLAVPVLYIGYLTWTERPLLVGLVGLAAVWLLADGRGRAWWALPLFWLWVNTHGSFPLGGVLVGCLLVGRALDREPVRTEARVLAWAVLGVLLGALNPIGPRLIVFPFTLLARSEALATVKEWQPPSIAEPETQLFAVLAVVTVVAFVRRRTWRQVLPAAVFVLAAATGSRNLGPATIVLAAAIAPSLAGLGREAGRTPQRVTTVAGVVVVAVALLAVVASLRGPHTDLVGYPTEAVTWLEREGRLGPDSRLVSREFVGNYLEARFGTEVPVFMDDRYDMYPLEVVADHAVLIEGQEAWRSVLERWEPTAVLWDRDSELGAVLDAEPDGWEVIYRDERWLVAVAR